MKVETYKLEHLFMHLIKPETDVEELIIWNSELLPITREITWLRIGRIAEQLKTDYKKLRQRLENENYYTDNGSTSKWKSFLKAFKEATGQEFRE